MPELPDIEAYVTALRRVVVGKRVVRAQVRNPFVLRTVEPPLRDVEGKAVIGARRVGKRVVLDVEGGLHLAMHLMIAGRLHWKAPEAKGGLFAIVFDDGALVMTEAGSKHRASLQVVRDLAPLRAGLEPLEASLAEFEAALRREDRTLKRAMTDPTVLSGVGNAYSDEILHRAKLSPILLTSRMTSEEAERLWRATRDVLSEWTARLVKEAGTKFPAKVTAFRPEFAVHGKFGEPCPVCQTTVQRIVRGDHETNYCPRCQTGGKVLADRALSKLLHDDWPRTVEAWEERFGA